MNCSDPGLGYLAHVIALSISGGRAASTAPLLSPFSNAGQNGRPKFRYPHALFA